MNPNQIYQVYDPNSSEVIAYEFGDGRRATEEQWQKQAFGETEAEYYDRIFQEQYIDDMPCAMEMVDD
jgi:IS1 family transposase